MIMTPHFGGMRTDDGAGRWRPAVSEVSEVAAAYDLQRWLSATQIAVKLGGLKLGTVNSNCSQTRWSQTWYSQTAVKFGSKSDSDLHRWSRRRKPLNYDDFLNKRSSVTLLPIIHQLPKWSSLPQASLPVILQALAHFFLLCFSWGASELELLSFKVRRVRRDVQHLNVRLFACFPLPGLLRLQPFDSKVSKVRRKRTRKWFGGESE